MFFLGRWISEGSLWFSSLIVRILGATGWLLGFQGEKRAVEKDVESGQDAVAGGVVSLSCRRLVHRISHIACAICRAELLYT